MMRVFLAAAAALAAAFSTAAAAETVKIGLLHTTGSGPVMIAAAKGYFAAEGLDAQLVYFESAQPISIAAASGDIDLAYTGLTGGFYGLASQGELRIVAGGARETPGFHYQPFLVSNHAWDAGLRAFKDLPGHSFGVSQIGSPPHYALGLIAEKYGFDVKTVRIQPLASIANLAAGIVGGQVDSVMMPGNVAVPVLAKDEAKLLGYIGDEAPYQLVGVIVSSKAADERHDMIEKSLAALRKGDRAYYDAFTPGGKRGDGRRCGGNARHRRQGRQPKPARGGREHALLRSGGPARRAGRAASARLVQGARHGEGHGRRRRDHRPPLHHAAVVTRECRGGFWGSPPCCCSPGR